MSRRILATVAVTIALVVLPGAMQADAQVCGPSPSPPCVFGEGETPTTTTTSTTSTTSTSTTTTTTTTSPPTVEPDEATPPVIDGKPSTPAGPTVLESVVRLPLTGTEIGPVGVLGLALTAAGVIFAVAGRRRRTSLDAAV